MTPERRRTVILVGCIVAVLGGLILVMAGMTGGF